MNAAAPAPAVLLAAAKESAPVTDVPQLIAWTVGCALLVALVYVLIWRGWKRRGRTQAETLPPLPAIPDGPADGASDGTPDAGPDAAPVLHATGMYHGSTAAGDWLARIVAHGLGTRGRAELALTAEGVRVVRTGAVSFLIPAEALLGARTDRGIAGKVVPEGGMLVITWRHGDQQIDTGFRSDHPDEHPRWVEALTAADRPGSPLAMNEKDA